MNVRLASDGGTSTISQSDKYKLCRQIRQQQVENYLQFVAREEKEKETTEKTNNKNKKQEQKEQKRKEKQEKNGKKKGKKKGVRFCADVCLQSSVEELDEKEVLKALKTDANFNYSTGNGTSLLHKACVQESAPMVELLLSGGAHVSCYDDDWWTPLHIACYQDNKEVVQILLKNGADTTLLDVDGNFALDLCEQGTETWELMIHHMEQQGLTEEKMKHLRGRQCKLMESDIKTSVLLASDLDKPLYDGVTLLHIASANGFYRVAKYLLRKGANPSPVDQAGLTPLHCVAKFNQLKTAELLIKHGADVGAKDFTGNRVIDLTSSTDIQKLLLASGAQQRRTVTSQLLQDDGGNDNNDDDDDDDDGRPEEMGSMTSRMIYSPGTPMSKADQLTEAKVLRQSPTEDHYYEPVGGGWSLNGEDGGGQNEYEDDEDIYYSAIWKTDIGEMSLLPEKSPTDDLSQLAILDETAILKTLVDRYKSGTFYTNIGDILIAMNPFSYQPIYGKNVSCSYHKAGQPQVELTPHIYAMAESVLRHILSTGIPHCCVIGGESGSGKTETSKHLVQYILWMAGSAEVDLTLKLAQVNLVLEAFGNAKTVMNSNSSRFAKHSTLQLSPSGKVVGGQIKEFLLEKSRVVQQGEGEANFHIFEWMLAGVTPDEAKQLYLDGQPTFRYLKTSHTDTVANVKAKFWEVKECLTFIGFSPEDVRAMLTTLSAVLHLGNVEFLSERKNEDVAMIPNLDTVRKVSRLLRVAEDDLVPALLEDILVTRGEQTKKPLTPSQARDSVDALAKALYSRLFSWIVNGLNQMVQSPEAQGNGMKSVGILDLFGFENLNNNKFEQMCINVANEKLQSFYNQRVFEIEMRDCVSEGLPYVDVSLPGNQEVISLFMAKNTGIFDLLDEESRFPKATDDSLATKLKSVAGKAYPTVYKTPRYGGPTFTVVHYAGVITYDLTGILYTNRDTLRPALSFVMRGSDSLVVKDLFQSNMSHTGSLNPSKRQRVSRHMKGAKSPFDFFKKLKMSKKDNARKKDAKKGELGHKKMGNTVTCHFKNSLQELMTHLGASSCHFVRCIKPNKDREALKTSDDYIQGQLYYTGVLETVRLRRDGFSLRASFPHFLKLYPTLTFMASSKTRFIDVVDHVTVCNVLLTKYHVTGFMVGRTKLFLKQHEVSRLDETERRMLRTIVLAQKVVRQFLARARVSRLRSERARYQAELEDMSRLMDQKTEKVLEGLKEFREKEERVVEEQKRKEDSVREENVYLDILDNVLEEYSEPMDPTEPMTDQLVFDGHHEHLATHLVPEDSKSRVEKFEENKSSSIPTEQAPPPPQPTPPPASTSTATTAVSKLREKFNISIPPPPTAPPPRRPPAGSGEINAELPACESGQTELRGFDTTPEQLPQPSIPQDEDMDPSRQYPLSPKEMYMYQGHYGGEPPMSPTRRQAPPSLPERRADTQLTGNRKSQTSSISSRSSSSSDVHYDTTTNPGNQHHLHHHNPHMTPQQQQQQQLLTMQIQQQLQRQQSLTKGSCTETNNGRPASYTVGTGSMPPISPHSPSGGSGVEMRIKNPPRDTSPYGARGNVKSDGAALTNHHHHNHHNHHNHHQQQHQQSNNQFVFTEDAIRHHDKASSAAPDYSHYGTRAPSSPSGHGNTRNSDVNLRGSSEGIYGEFVRPASSTGSGRPSLTYVPPPVVPTLHQNNNRNSNGSTNGLQQPSSPSLAHHHHHHHQHQHQQHHHHHHHDHQQQHHHPSNQTNINGQNNHNMHHHHNNNINNNNINKQQNTIPTQQQHQHQLQQAPPPLPSSASPKLTRSNNNNNPTTNNSSIYNPPSFPAPPPPVPVQDRYTSNVDQHQHQYRSASPPPPPPPPTSTTTASSSSPFPYSQNNASTHPNNAVNQRAHHAHHPPKAPPSHTPPPPPGPPPTSSNAKVTNAQQRPRHLDPAGSGSPRNASPARPPPHTQHKQQQVAATADELAQIKLRNVADLPPNKPPSNSPSKQESSVINFKLKSTPGNVDIYSQRDTTAVLPPPIDDLDDLPPPPPPPELCPPSPPPPPMHFDPSPTPANNPYPYYQSNRASPGGGGMAVPTAVNTPPPTTNAAPHHPSPASYLPQNQTGTTNSNTPTPGGPGNAYLQHHPPHHHHHHQHHQHHHTLQQQYASTTAANPPPPSPSPPPPPPPSSSSPTHPHKQQQPPQQHQPHQHLQHSSPCPSDSIETGATSTHTQEGSTSVDREKIIADCLAAMDWIPDDIDLSQCPGLVEITKATPNWKREMIEKKNQDKIEDYVKKIMKQREQEEKWKNIPAWKRRLLEQKDKDGDGEADMDSNSAPSGKKAASKVARPLPEEDMKPKGDIVPAALSIDPEELAAMPPWKRELLFKRDKVPITFSNEFNPDEEEGEGEGGEGVVES